MKGNFLKVSFANYKSLVTIYDLRITNYESLSYFNPLLKLKILEFFS